MIDLIKKFLRGLKYPLIPYQQYLQFMECQFVENNNNACINANNNNIINNTNMKNNIINISKTTPLSKLPTTTTPITTIKHIIEQLPLVNYITLM